MKHYTENLLEYMDDVYNDLILNKLNPNDLESIDPVLKKTFINISLKMARTIAKMEMLLKEGVLIEEMWEKIVVENIIYLVGYKDIFPYEIKTIIPYSGYAGIYYNENNQFHREDGPAFVYNDKEYFFFNGVMYNSKVEMEDNTTIPTTLDTLFID